MRDDGADLTRIQNVSPTVIPYSSAHGRARSVITLFGVGICLILMMFALHLQQYWQMGRMMRGEHVSERALEFNYFAQYILALTYLIWLVATAVAFLIWIHRAHRNLPSLGASDLEFSPAGAVGWYFFPFLNLFKPYQVMREIYNASDPDNLPYEIARWRDHGAMIVKAWWASFILMSFISRAVGRVSDYPESPGAFQFVAGASIVDDMVTVVAMLLAITLVASIDRRQARRASQLSAAVVAS